jgi:transcriptional regulator with XRE-family HTH domain
MPSSGTSQVALGVALRELRKEKKLTQEDLARRASVGVRVVAGIERGEGNPRWSTLEAILTAMKIDLLELAERMAKKG